MGPIVVCCRGLSWQEGYARVCRRLYRLAASYFRARPDRDERVQLCVLHLMERCRRQWSLDGQVVLWPREGLRRAVQGREWHQAGEARRYRASVSVRADRPLPGDVAAPVRRLTDYTDQDCLLDAARLGEDHTAAARAALGGMGLEAISRRVLGCRRERARAVLVDVACAVGAG